MKKVIISVVLTASIAVQLEAANFKTSQDVINAFVQQVAKAFGSGNIFQQRLFEPKSYTRFPATLSTAYKQERWYGSLASFMLQDLKQYITEQSTIALKGLDKDIMASYEVLAQVFKALIDIIQELAPSAAGALQEDNAIQIASGVCSLKKEVDKLKGELNNQKLIKLAKEFTTAKSKKDAIAVLQKIQGGLLDLVEKTIRDGGRIAQAAGVPQPQCCVASGNQACKVIDFSNGKRPGIMPKLSSQG